MILIPPVAAAACITLLIALFAAARRASQKKWVCIYDSLCGCYHKRIIFITFKQQITCKNLCWKGTL